MYKKESSLYSNVQAKTKPCLMLMCFVIPANAAMLS